MKFFFRNLFIFLWVVTITACSTIRVDHGEGVTSASAYLLNPADVAAFTKMAEHGDAEASFKLSNHYYASQDGNAGFLWQYIAASQKHPIAQYNMANFNFTVYRNVPLARFWLNEAAKNGLKKEYDYLSPILDDLERKQQVEISH